MRQAERIRVPKKDFQRRKSAMLWMRGGERESRKKSHCSNDIIQFTYEEECVNRENSNAQERHQTSQICDASHEKRRGSGEKKSHRSNDIIQFVFLKSRFQMKWLLQKNIFILPAILRRSSIRKTTLTFQGFQNLTPAKRNKTGSFHPFHFKIPFFPDGERKGEGRVSLLSVH
ncbi:hypothetical protein CEXT_205871 [Caerostris extrusa]|uniref:Uncharacterized protein n=1 Tax=Caerostris extrusa TaxID=172846 RepID=A0AAV4TRJ6_CAEEX|nr:hypothetical protein CEXT_205871 [Caerostris extrusa]